MPKNNNVIDILDDAEISVKAECLTATILELSHSFNEDDHPNVPVRESITKALANIAQHHITSLQEAITELMQHGYEHEEIHAIDGCLTDLHFTLESIKTSLLSLRYLHPLAYGLRFIAAKLERRIDNLPDLLERNKEAQS